MPSSATGGPLHSWPATAALMVGPPCARLPPRAVRPPRTRWRGSPHPGALEGPEVARRYIEDTNVLDGATQQRPASLVSPRRSTWDRQAGCPGPNSPSGSNPRRYRGPPLEIHPRRPVRPSQPMGDRLRWDPVAHHRGPDNRSGPRWFPCPRGHRAQRLRPRQAVRRGSSARRRRGHRRGTAVHPHGQRHPVSVGPDHRLLAPLGPVAHLRRPLERPSTSQR